MVISILDLKFFRLQQSNGDNNTKESRHTVPKTRPKRSGRSTRQLRSQDQKRRVGNHAGDRSRTKSPNEQ